MIEDLFDIILGVYFYVKTNNGSNGSLLKLVLGGVGVRWSSAWPRAKAGRFQSTSYKNLVSSSLSR